MAILDRMHRAVNALLGSGNAVLGIVEDLVRAPFTEDEYQGIAGTIFGSTVKRGTELFSIPPQQPILPEKVLAVPKFFWREGVAEPVRNIGSVLETGYREGIAEPISTLATVGSIGKAEDDQFAFLSPRVWNQAYRIAQHRSPAQAAAIAGTGINIYDEAELASYIGSDAYKRWSGAGDFLLRVFADPTVFLGKGAKALRAKYIAKELHTPEDLINTVNSPQFATWLDDIKRIKGESPDTAAAVIRDRYFADHPDGAQISSILHSAPTDKELYWSARALLGDMEAYNKLENVRSALAGPIGSLNKRVEELAPIRAAEPYRYEGTIVPTDAPSLLTSDTFVPGAGYDDILRQSLIDELAPYELVDARLSRTLSAFENLTQAPRSRSFSRVPAIGEVRTAITRSDFYQSDPLSRPLHRIFDMAPQSMILASGRNGDVQLNRLMTVAELPLERREQLRTQFINTFDKSARQRLAVDIENETVAHIAKQAGLTVDEVDDLVMKISGSRDKAMHAIARRQYDENGNSKVLFEGEEGAGVSRHFPSWITQDDIIIPLVDINKVKHAASRVGQYRAKVPGAPLPDTLMEGFYRLWKPAVLIRPAWTVRVVGDEQMRILAKVGAITHIDNIYSTLFAYTTDYVASVKDRGFLATRGRSNKELRTGFAVRGFQYRGYDGEGAFGVPGDIRKHIKESISSANQFDNQVGNRESIILREFREAGEQYRTIYPDDDGYAKAYEWGIGRLKNHPIAQQILKAWQEDFATPSRPRRRPDDELVDGIATWLQTTPEGLDILRANEVRGYNARNWVTAVKQELDAYTAGSDELADLIAKGTATHADLLRVQPDPSAQPFVHGESLRQSLGEGYMSRKIAEFTRGAFNFFGKVPTDVASRNRFFDEIFQAEVKRRVDLIDGDYIPPSLQARIRDNSRQFADAQVKELLYDLAEQSQFGVMLKFLSPFFNASREVATRWAGLAIENPAFIARARMAFRAPDKAGLVTDSEGRPVIWGQEYSDDPLSENYRDKERYIAIPIPDWVKDIPGMRGIESKGSIAFNKKSFSILTSMIGFGPPVQLLVNEIVKDRPGWEDSVKFILPHGPTQRRRDLLLPASAKRAISGLSEDQQFLNDKIRIMLDKTVDIERGLRPDFDKNHPDASKRLYEEATAEAKALYALRWVSANVLPAAATYRSPYQMYIEALNLARARYYDYVGRKAAGEPVTNPLADQDGNERTPDEWFYDTYGKEYFALTQAVTRTMDGIPATVSGWEKRKEFQDLVEKYADTGLAGVIIGEDSGEFNSVAYQLQLKSDLRPGSNLKQREPISFEEAAKDPERRLGWIEYRRAMDLIENIRIQRGLPNLQVAAAKDLAAAKSAVTTYLQGKYPAWKDDFNQADKGKWEKKINALRDISSRPEMQGRADMQGVRLYLQARDEFTKLLAGRKKAGGASTLTASSNQDIAEAWNVVTGHLIESNLPFSSVFYRHLENDPLGL